MSATLETTHGLKYLAPSDKTSWLNVFNPLVIKLEDIITTLETTDTTTKNELETEITNIKSEIVQIQSTNTLQNSNILALQTAIDNLQANISTVKNNLDVQLNYGYKVRRGISNLSFDSNGYADIAHNLGFTDINSYSFVCNAVGLVVIGVTNKNTNVINVGVRNINTNGQLVPFTGTANVHWIVVGK